MDLFEFSADDTHASSPLAEQMRPKTFESFIGHNKALQSFQFLKDLKKGQADHLPHLILWGPPGTGKTSFAKLLSYRLEADFHSLNAIDAGTKELKEFGRRGYQRRLEGQTPLVLFLDEIHRLNRSQQDVFLPFLERGDLRLIGATTENPSYELNRALLSRVRILKFELLSLEDLKQILFSTLNKLKIEPDSFLDDQALEHLTATSAGDARRLLNNLELLLQEDPTKRPFQKSTIDELMSTQPLPYDKSRDSHYDTISAFIKSIRGSDPDAAVYYLARMLAGGEDPLFIARRLVILASEDIGNAEPRALPLAVAGAQAVELIGLPEAAINLSHVTTFLAGCPKSNRSYLALRKAQKVVSETGALAIPMSLRSAQTELSKEVGHGEGYQYAHDDPRGYKAQDFLPPELVNSKFYEPKNLGFEKTVAEYLKWIKQT